MFPHFSACDEIPPFDFKSGATLFHLTSPSSGIIMKKSRLSMYLLCVAHGFIALSSVLLSNVSFLQAACMFS